MIRRIITLGWAALLLMVIVLQAPAYPQTSGNPSILNNSSKALYRNQFFYTLFAQPTSNPDSVQIIVFTSIANSLLQFVLQDTTYIAEYELTTTVRDESGTTVGVKIGKDRISTPSFQETNERTILNNSKLSFTVRPGQYIVYLELVDQETNVPIKVSEDILAPDFFSGTFALTDLLFFHGQTGDSLVTIEPFPNLSAVHTLADSSFLAKMYVCSDGSIDTIRITQTILSNNDQPVFERLVVDIPIRGRIQPVIFNLNKEYTFGQYILSVSATDGTTTEGIKKPFYVRWKTHTTFLPNLSQTVETLRYIMNSAEWEQLQQLPPEEQTRVVEEFWEDRDPDPSTEENELEEEYYRRVVYANQHFSVMQGNIEGWRTDRGRVHIIHGHASNIERPVSTQRSQRQYEIWYYAHLQRRFIFLDRYG